MRLLEKIRVRIRYLPISFGILWYKYQLREKNLHAAHEELMKWRRLHIFDEQGRALRAPSCSCGLELKLWPRNDTPIWCDFVDWTSNPDQPTVHDVYSLDGQLFTSGRDHRRPAYDNVE